MGTRKIAKLAIGKAERAAKAARTDAASGKVMTAVKVFRTHAPSGMYWMVLEEFDGSEKAIAKMQLIR
jgi:hypothetical protein